MGVYDLCHELSLQKPPPQEDRHKLDNILLNWNYVDDSEIFWAKNILGIPLHYTCRPDDDRRIVIIAIPNSIYEIHLDFYKDTPARAWIPFG